MTWVLGMSTRFDYVTCVSDIQVSWGDSEFHNCLKKTYKITDSLAAAFAGSVKIGFDLVEDLRGQCRTDTESAGSPKALIARWPRHAHHIFAAASLSERRNRSQLLILGIEREHDESIPVLYKLESPTFNPEKANAGQAFSIGCGSMIYKPVLDEIAQQSDPLTVYESRGFAGKGIGCGLMMVMTTERQQRLAPGISEELLCTVLAPSEFQQFPYRSCITDANTGNTREVDMPTVAESYAAFKIVAESYGLQAAGARAGSKSFNTLPAATRRYCRGRPRL